MEVTVQVDVGRDRHGVLGSSERNLKMIREALGVRVSARDGRVQLRGERRQVAAAQNVLDRLAEAARERRTVTRQQVLELIADESGRLASPPDSEVNGQGSHGWEGDDAARDAGASGPGAWSSRLGVYASGRPVRPMTPNQEHYLEAIRTHDMVFAIGPAGTGKTYLAVAAAVHLLRADRVRKVILVRPAVEAGEKLGFLPGDIQSKVNPYLRPLFDALHDMVDFGTIRRFLENDVVEVVPLAFMRGRTLNSAVVILDEAQNTTRGQMQMFLTRMGRGSKMIVTGDVTQIDLPDPRESGLIDAARRLRRVPGIAFVALEKSDVVRHDLVQRVVEAYGDAEGSDRPARAGRARGAAAPAGGEPARSDDAG